jgi:hypothetical protein
MVIPVPFDRLVSFVDAWLLRSVLPLVDRNVAYKNTKRYFRSQTTFYSSILFYATFALIVSDCSKKTLSLVAAIKTK